MESKKDIRKCVLEKRNCISKQEWEEKSRLICEKVVTHPFFLDSNVICCYVDYRNEVRTREIIETAWKQSKKVAVPKVYGDIMKFIYLDDLTQVEKSDMGIPEPVADEPVAEDQTALVLMPGLAFDKEGHRIGYGGGFYDKFLMAEPSHPTVALCYEFQMYAHLDTEEFDIPVDLVLWA